MIQLGCNYSPQLIALLEQGKIEVDWIKLSRRDTVWQEVETSKPYAPMLLHTIPHASLPTLDGFDIDDINKAIKACGSPHIALHLMAMKEDWPKSEEIPDEEMYARMLNGVLMWKEQMCVDLLIENVPFYGHRGTLRYATDPEVITRICEEANVGFLLDIAHLRVSAWHRGEDAEEYLMKLPLERVREIHVCGPAPDPDHGYLRDRHLELQEIDYKMLTRALELTNPSMVTLEYGGTGPKFEWRSDIGVIERQIVMLRNILNL